MPVTYTFQRGEPASLIERVKEGGLPASHSMKARMKPAPIGGNSEMPGDAVPTVTPAWASVFVPAGGGEPDHYLHTLTAAQTLLIAKGNYLFDSSLWAAGTILQMREPVIIKFKNAAST